MLSVIMAAISLACAIPLFSQSGEVSDDKLAAVAKAYVQVREIQNAYRPQIESARTQEEAQRLQREADQKMVEVIQAYLTVDEYASIWEASDQDDVLRQRLLFQIQRVQEESGG